jgi:hypothetical protein
MLLRCPELIHSCPLPVPSAHCHSPLPVSGRVRAKIQCPNHSTLMTMQLIRLVVYLVPNLKPASTGTAAVVLEGHLLSTTNSQLASCCAAFLSFLLIQPVIDAVLSRFLLRRPTHIQCSLANSPQSWQLRTGQALVTRRASATSNGVA